MVFRTEISFHKDEIDQTPKISYQHKILMLGSCFTENISQKLKDLGYCTWVNPLGISYQPFAITDTIDLLLNDSFAFHQDHLLSYLGKYHSLIHHGEYSHVDPQVALERMNTDYWAVKHHIQGMDHLLITLGTSWAYRLKEQEPYPMIFDHRLVNNCHQLPHRCFDRVKLSIEEIKQQLIQSIQALLRFNPRLNLIFTVSPIRHIKDQLIQNQLSKAQLIIVVHELLALFPENCRYFPAYELLMDDLRDYRFYASDMLHPSDVAIQYIWDKFESLYLPESERMIRLEVSRWRKTLEHRILDPLAPQSIRLIQQREENRMKLLGKYPYLKI